MLDWMLDLLVAGLLLATIASCARLHRRLGLLRAERDELARFVGAFDAAVQRADAAIKGLGRAGDDAAARLAGPAERATRAADELRLLIERGERVTDRLAADIEAARRAPPARPAGPAAMSGEPRPEEPEPDADELRRVLEALR